MLRYHLDNVRSCWNQDEPLLPSNGHWTDYAAEVAQKQATADDSPGQRSCPA